MGEEERRDW